MITMPHFIVADNDPQGILLVHGHLEKEFTCRIEHSYTEETLEQKITQSTPTILFYDLNFPSPASCINSLKRIQLLSPELTIIPLVPVDMLDLVKELLGLQLFFYITKPIDIAEITITIRRALETISLRQPKSSAPTNIETHEISSFQGMIGRSPSMSQLFDIITRVADDDFSTVLIRGESGTGKEMVAKAIHQQGKRKLQNFVPVNCAAIPDELLESELFGYAKGAFTGATTNKLGRIQYADHGTLFLDEIGDMKPSLQAKLLRVIQEREFEPVGAFKTISVDTRILAATHCNLEQLVEQGLFREDLYYRLSVIPLNIPPLRERREDITLLIRKFIDQYTTERNRDAFTFSSEATASLLHHDWRGNVRELENLIQHMSVLYSGKVVEHRNLPQKFQNNHYHLTETIDNERFELWSPSTLEETSLEFTKDFSSEREALFSSPLPPLPEEPIAAFHFHEEETTKCLENPRPAIEQPLVYWVNGSIDFKEVTENFENQLIIEALIRTKGNKKEAASILNLKRTTLLEKIKKKGLQNSWENEAD